MSGLVGPQRMFVLEAAEHADQLDALLTAAHQAAPDAAALARGARALRGSATMYRQPDVLRVAAALERAAVALREERVPWGPALGAAMTGAVDDVRLLLRSLAEPDAQHRLRAAARTEELERLVPAADTAAAAAPAAGRAAPGAGFLAAQATALAAALEQSAAAPTDSEARSEALRRVRAVRGVAAVGDLPPLGEVADTVERAVRGAEPGRAEVGDALAALLRAAAAVLRRAAGEIAAGQSPRAFTPEMQRFGAAAVALAGTRGDADRIVPIAELYHADEGPHIVSQAPHPPTTPGERFRLEVVSQAEHLRRVLGEAGAAADAPERERAGRALERALHALAATARSFGEDRVAGLLVLWSARAVAGEPHTLATLDRAARLLAEWRVGHEDLVRQLEALDLGREPAAPAETAGAVPGSVAQATVPAARPAARSASPSDLPAPPLAAAAGSAPAPVPPAPRAAPPRRAALTPTGAALRALLDTGIAGIGRLDEQPLTAPLPLDAELVVPIETLLYRGRAALDRARALGAELRRAPAAPSADVLSELYDLLDLAAAE